MTRQIDCAIHDYFEAICVLQYEVLVEMNDGIELLGRAVNLLKSDRRVECLVLHTDKKKLLLEIDQIVKLEVLSPNARFNEIPL